MFKIKDSLNPFFGFVLVIFLILTNIDAKAQCYGYHRIYATSESANSNVNNSFGHLFDNADVTNSSNSLGNNLTDFSSIGIPLLTGTRFQRLQFPQTFTGQEPIHVKLASTVDFSLTGITAQIQAYSGTTPVGTAVVISTAPLTNVLSGENISDILIPNPGSSYDGVQITLTGGFLSTGSINIYAAYINELVTTKIDCNTTADVIYGTTSGLLGGVNSITNPYNAADADLTTYAILNQNLGAAGYVFVTSILPTPSVSGDLVSVTFQVPGTPLIGADLFTNLSVIAYLGNTQVAVIPANDATIDVRLLDATNNIYQFTYPVNASFDRISVQAGGIATAIAQVYVYDIRKLIPKPIVKIDGVVATAKSFCVGLNTTLTVDPTQSCTTYNWYDAPTGGNLLSTGASYVRNALPVGTYEYYVEAIRDNCLASSSERTKITITVNPLPTITLGPDPSICIETLTALLPFTATTGTPTSYSITWSSATLANVVNAAFPTSSPITISIAAGATAATYSGTLTLKNANGCVGNPVNFNVIINPKLPKPTVNITSN